MARKIGRLTALKVDHLRKPGMHADGAGLYLRVTPISTVTVKDGTKKTRGGTRNWVLRYMLNGRPRWMGLGPLHTLSLADARTRATAARLQRHDGVDPIEARRSAKQVAQLDAAKAVTFKDCAERYIDAHKAGWRTTKHETLWTGTLKTYAYPTVGALPVQAIDTGLVLKVLEPIWSKKPETAGRVRQRIEAILDWAKVRGYRAGENPARWHGHLDVLLPARGKVRRVEHHAALPYLEIGAFMVALQKQEGTAACAFEFAILTAARTGETIGATWGEIDLAAKVWTIPAARMKAVREHRVPLSTKALAILEEMKPLRVVIEGRDPADEFVFPGAKHGQPLSNMAFLMLLRRMDRSDLTAHGFRSTFRDWCAERTSYPREVAEMALAHTIGDKVEAAYRRGDLFDKRKRLMDEWSKFCATLPAKPEGKVEPLRSAR